MHAPYILFGSDALMQPALCVMEPIRIHNEPFCICIYMECFSTRLFENTWRAAYAYIFNGHSPHKENEVLTLTVCEPYVVPFGYTLCITNVRLVCFRVLVMAQNSARCL